ncbi:hypothetical protein [Caballeronia sordidicola]|uniref:hypothetical protein n=1 Tax=Caballeronia sordidicola TaxID=196367 RepID=UPI00094DCC36|nr:hypothetical protein [Caballeronia sordidicola]
MKKASDYGYDGIFWSEEKRAKLDRDAEFAIKDKWEAWNETVECAWFVDGLKRLLTEKEGVNGLRGVRIQCKSTVCVCNSIQVAMCSGCTALIERAPACVHQVRNSPTACAYAWRVFELRMLEAKNSRKRTPAWTPAALTRTSMEEPFVKAANGEVVMPDLSPDVP